MPSFSPDPRGVHHWVDHVGWLYVDEFRWVTRNYTQEWNGNGWWR